MSLEGPAKGSPGREGGDLGKGSHEAPPVEPPFPPIDGPLGGDVGGEIPTLGAPLEEPDLAPLNGESEGGKPSEGGEEGQDKPERDKPVEEGPAKSKGVEEDKKFIESGFEYVTWLLFHDRLPTHGRHYFRDVEHLVWMEKLSINLRITNIFSSLKNG